MLYNIGLIVSITELPESVLNYEFVPERKKKWFFQKNREAYFEENALFHEKLFLSDINKSKRLFVTVDEEGKKVLCERCRLLIFFANDSYKTLYFDNVDERDKLINIISKEIRLLDSEKFGG